MITSYTPYRALLALTIMAVLNACSTLPRDGPSGRSVERLATSGDTFGRYTIVNLDYATSEIIKAQPPQYLGSLVSGNSIAPGGLIGTGDLLTVTIFEPSGALFGGGGANDGIRSGNQNLPGLVVDTRGAVNVPYAGSVLVAGLTPGEASSAIRRALIGKVGNPQVVVSIGENAFNAVNVIGEIKSPGRAPLSSNSSSILDVIASRGGAARPPEDILVSIQRDGRTYTAPLTAVTTDFNENIRLARGDQINLIFRPRRFSTFGALGAVTQVDMAAGTQTLAGALSRVGGLDTNTADARSVLLFRFERPEVARSLGLTQAQSVRGVPVVYRLNLAEAEGFFIASNFEMMPDDIVYVPRSGSAELGKFFTLVQTITRVVYDVSVTSTLNTN